MGVNFVMLLENRHSQIGTIKTKLRRRKTRIIYFIFNYVAAFLFILPFYLEDTDQLELRKFVLTVRKVFSSRHSMWFFTENAMSNTRFFWKKCIYSVERRRTSSICVHISWSTYNHVSITFLLNSHCLSLELCQECNSIRCYQSSAKEIFELCCPAG